MSAVREWFVVNVADAPTVRHPIAGTWTRFERPGEPFQDTGINLRVLEPGQPSTIYHAEDAEENFLVLSGRCLALIGGQERELGAWDFLHLPPGVPHTFVGAGEGPCAILMIGARHPELRTFYPRSERAAEFGASASGPTESPAEAYVGWAGHSMSEATLSWPPSAI
jgi:mannose-6-phosphate isomerase-like protein (cupin superfamily)